MKKIKDIWANTNKASFWICLCLSAAFLVAGFIVPPLGSISPSVLTACGELFGFATLGTVIYGIEKGSDVKIKKGDIEVHLDNPDERK